MVRMIFSDFDNTMLQIYSDKNSFDDYQLNILRRVKDSGILFSIVTGRSVYFFIDCFSEVLEYVDYIIASNGAVIYDVRNDIFVYNKFFKKSELDGVLRLFSDDRYDLLFNCLKEQYSNDVVLDQYFSLNDMKCEQVMVRTDVKYIDDVLDKINIVDSLAVNNVSVHGNDCTIDINCNGVSKGGGISWLCNSLKVDLKDTIGFGDGENDLSVFEVVGKSVAVGNASDSVREKCDDVSLGCDKNGIFHYIEDNILKYV